MGGCNEGYLSAEKTVSSADNPNRGSSVCSCVTVCVRTTANGDSSDEQLDAVLCRERPKMAIVSNRAGGKTMYAKRSMIHKNEQEVYTTESDRKQQHFIAQLPSWSSPCFVLPELQVYGSSSDRLQTQPEVNDRVFCLLRLLSRNCCHFYLRRLRFFLFVKIF